MLYTIFDPNFVKQLEHDDYSQDMVQEATVDQFVYTDASSEAATINLILSNERSRTTILKLYDKDKARYQVDGEMTPVLDSAIAHSLPTERYDARKIASVLLYLEKTRDSKVLEKILRAYPTIKSLQRTAAHERIEQRLSADKTLDEFHHKNLNDSFLRAAHIDVGELMEVAQKELPGFQKADQSELTISIINYLGFLCFLDRRLDALDGVILACSKALIDWLAVITKAVYSPVLKDRLLAEKPEYFDDYFPDLSDDIPWQQRTFVTPDDARFSRLMIPDESSAVSRTFATALEVALKSMDSISFPQLVNERLGKKLQDDTQEIVDSAIDQSELMTDQANALDYSLFRTIAMIKLLDRQLKYADKMALDEKNRRDRLAQQQEAAATSQLEVMRKQHEKDQCKIEALNQKLDTANDAIAQLDRLRMDYADANDEIAYLKEIAVVTQDQQKISEANTEVDLDAVINRFNQKGVVFVGGDVNWIQKMENLLPEAKFVDTDQLGRSTKVFENASIIVLNVGTMSHSMYGKAKKSISDGAELYYINSQQSNEEKTLRYLAVAKNKN